MARQDLRGDLHVAGRITCESMTVPASAVNNAAVASDAAIVATKLEHQFVLTYGQNGTASSVTIPIHVATGSGQVIGFNAGSIAACVGAATIVVDLKKNGSSILTGTITLDNANTARVVEAATISSAAYVAGDFFELVVTATAGGGTLGTGLAAAATFREFT